MEDGGRALLGKKKMTGQKQRIIRRLEKRAKEKYAEMESAGIKLTCACSKPKWHLVSFNVDEIKDIINFRDDDEDNDGPK